MEDANLMSRVNLFINKSLNVVNHPSVIEISAHSAIPTRVFARLNIGDQAINSGGGTVGHLLLPVTAYDKLKRDRNGGYRPDPSGVFNADTFSGGDATKPEEPTKDD